MGRPATLITLPRVLDLSNLLVAYLSYVRYIESEIEQHPDYMLRPEGDQIRAHREAGEKLLRKYRSITVAGLNQYLVPLVETHKIPNMGNLINRIGFLNEQGDESRGLFLYKVFRRMFQDKRILTETFTSTARLKAQALMMACAVADIPTRLHKIAAIAPLSGLQVAKVWTTKAAGLLGEPISDTESVLTDAEAASTLGKEIGRVSAKLDLVEPDSEEAVDLARTKRALTERVQMVADSSKSPDAVLGAAAVAVEKGKARSSMAVQLNMSPAQEDALLAEGRVIIAASAGAGKTRVIAGKVVHTIKELGIPPQRIIATSFSAKSAYELKDRIKKFGGAGLLEGAGAQDGMGTTHSISLRICREYRRDLNTGNIINEGENAGLLRLAMKQVEMKSMSYEPKKAPTADDLLGPYSGVGSSIPGADGPVTEETMIPGEVGPLSLQDMEAQFKEAVTRANEAVRVSRTPYGLLFWLREGNGYRFLPDMVQKGWSLLLRGFLSEKQRGMLEKAFVATRVSYTLPTSDELKAAQNPEQKPEQPVSKMADYRVPNTPARNLRTLEYFKNNPANQWFNLGEKLVDENGRPLGYKSFSSEIGKWQADIVAPGQAWADGQSIQAAVYGAYDWLKKNTMETSGRLTFDDMLIEATRTLIHDSRVRGLLQERYKYIMVDEAQDQNSMQHLLFGLISGYYSAETRKPNADGSMTATSYCMIGDSDQAIYRFRGARPEEFINKSDTLGGDFSTKMLDMKYRSGSSIVKAADTLIKHNEKRIPMTCSSHPKKGEGTIKAVVTATNETGAAYMAQVIEDQLKDGITTPADFGVAVRTNAEAYSYTIELLKKNIPFRSKVDMFNDKSTKAIVAWMRLADADSTEETNEAVTKAFEAPAFNLDTVFVERVRTKAKGKNYLDWLAGGGWKWIYEDVVRNGVVVSKQAWRNEKNVLPYLQAMLKVREWGKQNLKPVELYDKILQLDGPFGSIIQAMVERVRNDPDILDLIRSETDDKQISEEAIEAMALAPLAPLESMLEGHEALTPALDFIRKLQEANKKKHKQDDVNAPDYAEPAVVIDTVHGWKGLETKHLFTSMAKGTFPHARAEDLEDERRLAYVAITRGEDNVTILCPEIGINGKPAGPSQFVAEACIPIEGGNTNPDAVNPRAPTPEELEAIDPLGLNKTASDEMLDEGLSLSLEEDLQDLDDETGAK